MKTLGKAMQARKEMKPKKTGTAQMALEYLMTYGWALIVIATVIAALVFVVSGPAARGSCRSNSTKLIVRGSTFDYGDDNIEFVLQNVSGTTLTLESDCISETDGTDIHENSGLATVCSPSTVRSGNTFVVQNLDSNASGNYNGAFATIEYVDEFGLSSKAKIICSGNLPPRGCAGMDCTDDNPCTVDSCALGQCSNLPLPDGANCGIGMECLAGECVAEPAGLCGTKRVNMDDGYVSRTFDIGGSGLLQSQVSNVMWVTGEACD